MSVNYSNATKTARMTAVKDQIDLGAAAGKLEIGTTGMATVLSTITLNDPSGTVSGSVLTLSGMPKTVNASATGIASAARIRDSDSDSDNNDVITGLTVGVSGSGADVIVDNTSIASG